VNKEELEEKINGHLKFKPIVKRLTNIDGCILCGGAIRDIYLSKTPKDYDFFFTSRDGFKEALYSLSLFKSEGSEYVKTHKTDDGEVQLILKEPFFNERDILSAFDFTTIQFAFNGKEVFIGEKTLQDVDNRLVGVNVISKPLQSLERLSRYTDIQKNGIHDWNIDETYKYILDAMYDKPSRVILNSKKYEF